MQKWVENTETLRETFNCYPHGWHLIHAWKYSLWNIDIYDQFVRLQLVERERERERESVCVCVCVGSHTCVGVSGLERGARVQMTLSLERGLEVKKEQGSTTKSPWTTFRLDSLMVTLSATVLTDKSGTKKKKTLRSCEILRESFEFWSYSLNILFCLQLGFPVDVQTPLLPLHLHYWNNEPPPPPPSPPFFFGLM